MFNFDIFLLAIVAGFINHVIYDDYVECKPKMVCIKFRLLLLSQLDLHIII